MAFKFTQKDKERAAGSGGGPIEYPLGATTAILTGIVNTGTRTSPWDDSKEITELWFRFELPDIKGVNKDGVEYSRSITHN